MDNNIKKGIRIRKKVVINIREKIKKTDPSFEHIKSLSYEIEDSIYDHCIDLFYNGNTPDWSDDQFSDYYKYRSRHIFQNMDPNNFVKNENLIHDILSGEISPRQLGYSFTSEDMFPERWPKQIIEVAPKIQIADGMFKCGKCKSWKTEHVQLQIRASDEGMSTKVYCTTCENRWKFS